MATTSSPSSASTASEPEPQPKVTGNRRSNTRKKHVVPEGTTLATIARDLKTVTDPKARFELLSSKRVLSNRSAA